eukprot:6057838-Amphidinium_carterae.1
MKQRATSSRAVVAFKHNFMSVTRVDAARYNRSTRSIIVRNKASNPLGRVARSIPAKQNGALQASRATWQYRLLCAPC